MFAGKEYSFGIIGHYYVCNRTQLTHVSYGVFRYSVIQDAVVSHYRIDKDAFSFSLLLPAVFSYHLDLFLGYYQSCAYGVKREPQLLPDLESIFHIIGRIQYLEESVIKSIGNEGRRQIVQIKAHMRHYRYHGSEGNLSVSCHIAYEQDFCTFFFYMYYFLSFHPELSLLFVIL